MVATAGITGEACPATGLDTAGLSLLQHGRARGSPAAANPSESLLASQLKKTPSIVAFGERQHLKSSRRSRLPRRLQHLVEGIQKRAREQKGFSARSPLEAALLQDVDLSEAALGDLEVVTFTGPEKKNPDAAAAVAVALRAINGQAPSRELVVDNLKKAYAVVAVRVRGAVVTGLTWSPAPKGLRGLEIYLLGTRSDARNRGGARAAVEAVIRYAEEEGYSWIFLESVPGSEKFYDRLGFVPLREWSKRAVDGSYFTLDQFLDASGVPDAEDAFIFMESRPYPEDRKRLKLLVEPAPPLEFDDDVLSD